MTGLERVDGGLYAKQLTDEIFEVRGEGDEEFGADFGSQGGGIVPGFYQPGGQGGVGGGQMSAEVMIQRMEASRLVKILEG